MWLLHISAVLAHGGQKKALDFPKAGVAGNSVPSNLGGKNLLELEVQIVMIPPM